MSSFSSLLLVVACAVLLQAGCEARQQRYRQDPNRQHGYRQNDNRQDGPPDRRNSNDESIALGSITGSNIITLPVIHLSGPDVIVGFPDNCGGEGLELLGTEVIVSNTDGDIPVDLVADDTNDSQSNVAIHCNWEEAIVRCPQGVDVASYQYCGGPLPPPTTTGAPTTLTTEPPSITSSSSSEE